MMYNIYSGGRLRELADKLRVPDDVVVGYIISMLLYAIQLVMLKCILGLHTAWKGPGYD